MLVLDSLDGLFLGLFEVELGVQWRQQLGSVPPRYTEPSVGILTMGRIPLHNARRGKHGSDMVDISIFRTSTKAEKCVT